jgi:hypothetical protein
MRSIIQVSAFAFMFFLLVSAQIPTDSLVALYKFTGNADNSVGNGRNGIVNGTTLTSDRFGNLNSAYSFSGNGSITLGHFSLFHFSQFTLSLWAKLDTTQVLGIYTALFVLLLVGLGQMVAERLGNCGLQVVNGLLECTIQL